MIKLLGIGLGTDDGLTLIDGLEEQALLKLLTKHVFGLNTRAYIYTEPICWQGSLNIKLFRNPFSPFVFDALYCKWDSELTNGGYFTLICRALSKLPDMDVFDSVFQMHRDLNSMFGQMLSVQELNGGVMIFRCRSPVFINSFPAAIAIPLR